MYDRSAPPANLRHGDRLSVAIHETMEPRILLSAAEDLAGGDAGLQKLDLIRQQHEVYVQQALIAYFEGVASGQAAAEMLVTRSTSFLDDAANPVTISIKYGQAQVTTSEAGGGRIEAIEVFPSARRCVLTITAAEGTVVGGITVHDSMAAVKARDVTLDGDLTVEGTLGKLVLGDVAAGGQILIHTDGDIPVPATAGLKATFAAATDCTISAEDMPIKSLTASAWVGGEVSASWIGRLVVTGELTATVTTTGAKDNGVSVGAIRIGDADGTVIDVPGGVRSLKVDDWAAGSIDADWLKTLTVGRRLDPGVFGPAVTLAGLDVAPGKSVLGGARIFGVVEDVTWTVGGAVGRIAVTDPVTDWTLTGFAGLKSLAVGDATGVVLDGAGRIGSVASSSWEGGSIAADVLGSMRIAGDLTNATIDLEQAPQPRANTLGTLIVKGRAVGSVIRSAGHVGSATFGGLTDTVVLVGLDDGYVADIDADGVIDLPVDPADFADAGDDIVATLKKFIVKGAATLTGDLLTNSNIAAGKINKAVVRSVRTDSEAFFGLSVGATLTSLNWPVGRAARRWGAAAWPADTGAFVVVVPGVNNDPRAADDAATTAEDAPVTTVDVLANDGDVNADPLTVSAFTQGAHGVVVDNGDGTFTYTGEADWFGDDAFVYTVVDGAGGTDTASVTITVTSVNDDPIAADDAASGNEDEAVVISGVLANDTDIEGDTLSIASITQGSNGTVVDNGDGTLTYTPDADFHGDDSFTYMISDGAGGTDTATVALTIAPVNDAPTAADDAAAGDEDGVITTGDVLANDSDAEGDALTITSFTQAGHGAVVNNGDGTFTYTPAADYNGADSFTYTVSDGNDGETVATVSITVNPVNDAPEATDDALVTNEDTVVTTGNVLANDTDADGDSLSVVGFTQGSHGAVVSHGDGSFTYTPDAEYSGADSFMYTVSDGADIDTAVVNITVNDVNDAPVAADDAATGDEDTDITTGDVLANDSDVEGNSLSIASFTQGAGGAVVDNGDATFTYTPDADFNGDDSFTYTISDGSGGTDTATVSITVNSVPRRAG